MWLSRWLSDSQVLAIDIALSRQAGHCACAFGAHIADMAETTRWQIPICLAFRLCRRELVALVFMSRPTTELLRSASIIVVRMALRVILMAGPKLDMIECRLRRNSSRNGSPQ